MSDEQKKIEAIVGQPVQIILQSMSGSTGYSWFLASLNGGLALSGAYAVPAAGNPGEIGPTNHVFDFLAIKEGKYTLEFQLIAPWRPGETGDSESYEVQIQKPKKTAADDIAAAMKGRDFVKAGAVNVGSAVEPSAVVKYAAPMAHTAVLKYAAPMVQPAVLKYAAPMAMNYADPCLTAMDPCLAAADPCLDPCMVNSGLRATTMIAYAAPSGPSTVAVNLGNTLRASTMIAYAAPVGPSTVAVNFANNLRAATTMIAYAAPVGPSTMAVNAAAQAMQCAQPLYAAPVTWPVQPLYAAPLVWPVQPLYAAPLPRTVQPLYAAPLMTQPIQPYAAPWTQNPCC